MKTLLLCLKLTSIATVFSLAIANSEVQAKKAISSRGAKALNKVATWGAIALFSTAAVTGNVLANNSDMQQAIQTQAPNTTEASIPLYEVVHKLSYTKLKAMLEAGEIDTTARDEKGNTALHRYAQYLLESEQQEEHTFFYLWYEDVDSLLTLILEYGVNPLAENNEGKTAMSYAYELADFIDDYESSVALALFAKAVYGINGERGNDPPPLEYALKWADYRGDVALARMLVKQGASVNLDGYEGYLDINSRMEAAVILVMEREAFLSVAGGHDGIERIVRERGVIDNFEGEHLLRLAAKWGNSAAADLLIEHGVDPSAGIFAASYAHGQGGTILVPKQDVEHKVLNILTNSGAEVNLTNDRGHTPLDFATENGQPIAVELLLTHGASPNVTDKYAMTPLLRASDRYGWVCFEMTCMLLARGAKVNVKNQEGVSPYDKVVENYNKVYTTNTNRPPYAATAALLLKQGFDNKTGKNKAKEWAELSGSKTIQKVIAGEIEIAQLFDRDTRARVSQELREAALDELAQKVITGEIKITQLFDEKRQRVETKLRQAGIKLEKVGGQ